MGYLYRIPSLGSPNKLNKHGQDLSWGIQDCKNNTIFHGASGKGLKIGIVGSSIVIPKESLCVQSFVSMENVDQGMHDGEVLYQILRGSYESKVLGIAPDIEIFFAKTHSIEGGGKPRLIAEALDWLRDKDCNCYIFDSSCDQYHGYLQDFIRCAASKNHPSFVLGRFAGLGNFLADFPESYSVEFNNANEILTLVCHKGIFEDDKEEFILYSNLVLFGVVCGAMLLAMENATKNPPKQFSLEFFDKFIKEYIVKDRVLDGQKIIEDLWNIKFIKDEKVQEVRIEKKKSFVEKIMEIMKWPFRLLKKL